MDLIAGLTAFSLGAMHALEPGHGKSAIAAYAVGYRSTPGHILVLGVSTAIAHTVSIFVLATILGATFSTLAGETAHQYIELVSGALLLLIGAWLLRRAVRNRQSTKDKHEAPVSCNCGQHQETANSNQPVTFGVVGLLGVSGGLIPCPTALAVLLAAIPAGRMLQGLWTVCLFSIGIALTLCTVALLACFIAKSGFKTRLTLGYDFSRWAGAIPVVSAVVIIGVGFVTFFRAAFHS